MPDKLDGRRGAAGEDLEPARDAFASLRQKLHPTRLRLSPRMRALVDFVLGERFTTPWVEALSITSDDFVVLQPADDSGLLHDELLGEADDLYRNYAGVLQVVGVTGAEARQFYDHYARRASDPDPTRLAARIVRILSGSGFGDAPGRAGAQLRRKRYRAATPHGVCADSPVCVEHARDAAVERCK